MKSLNNGKKIPSSNWSQSEVNFMDMNSHQITCTTLKNEEGKKQMKIYLNCLQALLEAQRQLRSQISNFTFNLGFSGKFYHTGVYTIIICSSFKKR